jgi:hypothetical protein
MVFTFPPHGPLPDETPATTVSDGRAIFVYLARGYRLHPQLPDALLSRANAEACGAKNRRGLP